MNDEINPLAGSNILIVDDIPANIRLLANILETEGYIVAAVTNGAKAIEHALKYQPDIILLDIRMPGMDGFSVCNTLQQQDQARHIPIIFITALNSLEDLIKGFECGGVDYLVKPFRQQEVLVRVKNHLKHKKLLQELQCQKDNAQTVNQLKDKFVSLVAHDLRAPLVSQLTCLSRMLEDQRIPDPYTQQLQLLVNNARNQLNLIERILSIHRLQSGALKLFKSQLDLSLIVDSAIKEIALTAETKQIQLQNQVPTNTFEVADAVLLREVCKNLISNAIKFSYPQSQVTIYSFYEQANTKKNIVIAVQDQGVGMDEITYNKLFQLGHIALPGTAGELGTGLGLSYCKDIMHAHGGFITVESTAQKGSTFYLHLPVV